MEKKVNLSMRIGVIALIVALISLVGISGTFAKYTSGGTAVDTTARVAKWGLTFNAGTDTLFKKTYTVGSGASEKVIVNSSGEMKLFAPGTSGSTSLLGTVSGTPEVAYKLTATVNTAQYDNIPTTGDAANYRPLKFTVSDGSTSTVVEVTGNDFKTALQTALTNLLKDTIYRPGTSVNAPTVTLSWEWPFTGDGQDIKDTALGNAASAAASESAAPMVTIDIDVAAEQANE